MKEEEESSLGISLRGIFVLKKFIKSVDVKRVLMDANIISHFLLLNVNALTNI